MLTLMPKLKKLKRSESRSGLRTEDDARWGYLASPYLGKPDYLCRRRSGSPIVLQRTKRQRQQMRSTMSSRLASSKKSLPTRGVSGFSLSGVRKSNDTQKSF